MDHELYKELMKRHKAKFYNTHVCIGYETVGALRITPCDQAVSAPMVNDKFCLSFVNETYH